MYIGRMVFDEAAAAYGVFQVVFGEVVDLLSVSTFQFRYREDSQLKFEDVFKQNLSTNLKTLRRMLHRFDDRSAVEDHLQFVRHACDSAEELAKWRNERIHARVQWSERGYSLFSWRTRQPLEMTADHIRKQIGSAIKVTVLLKAHVPHLVGLLDWDAEFDRVFGSLPQLSDSEDVQVVNEPRFEG